MKEPKNLERIDVLVNALGPFCSGRSKFSKQLKFDENEIRREIANKAPGIYEIRILMNDYFRTKLSAYFDRDYPDLVIDMLINMYYPIGCNVNFYLTSNPLKEYCRSREQFDTFRKSSIMSQDCDVARLTWLALDIDPIHPAGTCATDSEKAAARDQIDSIIEYMDKCGLSGPEIVDSGNGYHVKYPIDLPNDEQNRDFIASVFDKLHELFPLVDLSAKNPSRVLKLPGTLAMKGQNFPERPHRMAIILQDPVRKNEGNVNE